MFAFVRVKPLISYFEGVARIISPHNLYRISADFRPDPVGPGRARLKDVLLPPLGAGKHAAEPG